MDAWQEPESPNPPDPEDRRTYTQTALGVLAVFVMHAVVGAVMFLLFTVGQGGRATVGSDLANLFGGIAVVWFMGLSVVQVMYVLPAMFYTRFRLQRSAMAAGMLIGAALTVVLQTACYGFFCVTSGIGG